MSLVPYFAPLSAAVITLAASTSAIITSQPGPHTLNNSFIFNNLYDNACLPVIILEDLILLFLLRLNLNNKHIFYFNIMQVTALKTL